MSAPALFMALAVMAADAPAASNAPQGEPLPAGAPTEDYPLTAWCYGAMSEYLDIYERVKPDLKAIDKLFGSSEPNEAEPYTSDMAAAHVELKVLADAVTAAEKASPSPIGPEGAQAVKLGRSVWAPAEAKTNRELARAWLSWALPDRCDTTARTLAEKSALLGQALKYNTPSPSQSDAPPAPEGPSSTAPSVGPPPTVTAPASPTDSEPSAQPSPAGAATPVEPPPAETAPTSPSGSEPLALPSPTGAATPSDQAPPPPTSSPQSGQPDPNGPVPDPTPQG